MKLNVQDCRTNLDNVNSSFQFTIYIILQHIRKPIPFYIQKLGTAYT